MKPIIFVDTEVSEADNKAYDFGAVSESGEKLHTGSFSEFHSFISNAKYLCGHNIIDHDSKYIAAPENAEYIDTLYLSPLMFPNRPYHKLLKDDKLCTDELNNPLNDSLKAMSLFYDEINAFQSLDNELKQMYYMLLKDCPYFSGFFSYLDYSADDDLETAILVYFSGRICENAPLSDFITYSPVELAYSLAMISATEKYSLIPRWVIMNYPKVDAVLKALRNTSCGKCGYCKSELDPKKYLSKYFGYPDFRTYNGEPLQENAVNAAAEHRSLLAIFPTGGGKSLTFQIPALMAGETERALTVVISPLQSLMKDQVDNLENRGIADAVTINGLLSPIERAEAIDRVESGLASILYISPESLRSVTIERLFLSRHIARFVIDEAHCFSAWGQDFRVDYLYIGDFIRELQEKKGNGCKIPVSCFTATAKQKVISDIKEYFKNKLDIELELFATSASRTNLRYEVLYKETDAEKYDALRSLIEQKNCPTIVYVSRTKRTRMLAEKLTSDGFKARAFNGKMESSEKQENQEAFINDEIQIIVATSAFGMGVDKANVKLVVHYDISDSLENYVQEAGRAGRDPSLHAECYVLFNDSDLDKHFMLLNQTKLSISEIQQVWKAVKDLTKTRPEVCCSPLEVARQAGWDDSVADIETRVKTAIQALENAGYLQRGKNVPRVYATSILVKNMIEASQQIESSLRFTDEQERVTAKRIISSLISSKSISRAGNEDAESRVDYLADRLGLQKSDIIHSIQMMREDKLLADTKDLTAYIFKTDTENKSLLVLRKFQTLEKFLLNYIDADKLCMNYKELNEAALANGIKSSSVNSIKTLFYYWTIRSYVQKEQDAATNKVLIVPKLNFKTLAEKREKSYRIAEFIIHYLFENSDFAAGEKEEVLVGFSILELMNAYDADVSEEDIEEALLFLSKINAIKLEGGFLVLYSGMRIKRLVLDNKIRYKLEDYKQLNEFYQQKIQQIHIVGEYANMMVRNYDEALRFVNDYFQMDYKKFLSQYFSGERAAQIVRNIAPAKYSQLFDTLSERQLEIIRDNTSQHIVVSAGPGSGKTRVLVHKLAALLLLEDVKHEQLLMLTFSRAAAIEFKQRLKKLITEHNANQYSLVDNYRSCQSVVSFANRFVKEISDRMKDEDIVAVSQFSGETKLIKHSGKYIETAVVDDIEAENVAGTTCVLTNTNREALIVMGILKQRNIPAKLIQSIDGFDMYDIAEIRYFLKKLQKEGEEVTPVISDNQWKNAIEKLKQQYRNSECLPLILDILTAFAETNARKYRTDFDMFLHESKIEDFYQSKQGVVTVSTMHKSKGREFDNVFMMLNDPDIDTDESKRKLYVGITRAKSLLHMHYTGDVFDKFTDAASTDEIDLHSYSKPTELIMQLSHRDVYLDFFKDKKLLILQLRSGTHLYAQNNRLYIRYKERLLPVLQFSSACYEKVKKLIVDGYKLYDAKIRFICAWKGKEDETETAVILPDIYFKL